MHVQRYRFASMHTLAMPMYKWKTKRYLLRN